MANTKISALTADTSPTSDDLIPTVNDPGGTPASKKVTAGNFITKAHGLSDTGAVRVSGGVLTSPSGTPDGTKFLRDDGSWQALAGGGDALTSNPLSQFASTTSLQLKGVLSDETGSGAAVFATSPTLVTPDLGTPSAATLTNATGLPVSGIAASTTSPLGVGSIELGHASDTTISRVSAGVIAVEGANVLVSGGALGTPSSATLTNATGLPVAGITASTSTALGVGSLELGHASDTTLSRSGAGQLAVEGVDVITTSNTKTLTNKTLTTPTITAPAITGAATADVIKPNNNTVTVTSNAGTCSAAYEVNTFTNSSAATMAITISTSGAVDGQKMIVRIYDFSAATQTIGWTNTENSTVSAPTTSNGSTTLPLTVGFMYNSATSKWRCIASA